MSPKPTQNTTTMSKKIFICGRVYDLSAHKPATIEKRIQKRIDSFCNNPHSNNPRLVEFSMSVTPIPNSMEVDVEFTFARNNLFAKEGVNPDFLNDSDGQFMMGMDGRFRPPVMWNMVQPFAPGRYDIPIYEFVPAYAGTSDGSNRYNWSENRKLQNGAEAKD